MRIDVQNQISIPLQETADLLLEADSFLERIGESERTDAELWKLTFLRLKTAKGKFIAALNAAIEIGGRQCK